MKRRISLIVTFLILCSMSAFAQGEWRKLNPRAGYREVYQIEIGIGIVEKCLVMVVNGKALKVELRTVFSDPSSGLVEPFDIETHNGVPVMTSGGQFRYKIVDGKESWEPSQKSWQSSMGEFRWRFEDSKLPTAVRTLLQAVPWWWPFGNRPGEQSWKMHSTEYNSCMVTITETKAWFSASQISLGQTVEVNVDPGGKVTVKHSAGTYSIENKRSEDFPGDPGFLRGYNQYFDQLPLPAHMWVKRLRDNYRRLK